MGLVLMSTLGLTFALQSRFSEQRLFDLSMRLTLAAFSLLALAHPNYGIATLACVPIAVLIAFWTLRVRPALLAAAS
jgi:hypothetical protein